jgi:hypothetical protein
MCIALHEALRPGQIMTTQTPGTDTTSTFLTFSDGLSIKYLGAAVRTDTRSPGPLGS